jgi:hypothetical protein
VAFREAKAKQNSTSSKISQPFKKNTFSKGEERSTETSKNPIQYPNKFIRARWVGKEKFSSESRPCGG